MAILHRVKSVIVALRSQQGVAVPMAILSVLILSTVAVGFSTLSAIEPTIANNQLRAAQARAIAEAGVERALWALSNPGEALGIPVVFTTAPAPYDGSQPIDVAGGSHAIGSFRVTVTNAAAPYERDIVAVGWVPSEASAGPKALQKIHATAINPQLIVKDPPAAVAVGGDLRVGSIAVNAQDDRSCGRKVGTLSAGDTTIDGAGADIRGAADGNDVRNQMTDAAGATVPPSPGDIVTNVSRSVVDGFSLTDADLRALRAFAKVRGTYLRSGAVFDSVNRMPEGLIFVDVAADTMVESLPPSDATSVRIDGPAPADPSGVWSGWLIVNGSLSIGGSPRMKGLVYTQHALSFRGTGTSSLSGAAIGRNVSAQSASSIGSDAGGSSSIVYDCKDVRTGGGKIPGRWTLKGGTYREVSGS